MEALYLINAAKKWESEIRPFVNLSFIQGLFHTVKSINFPFSCHTVFFFGVQINYFRHCWTDVKQHTVYINVDIDIGYKHIDLQIVAGSVTFPS